MRGPYNAAKKAIPQLNMHKVAIAVQQRAAGEKKRKKVEIDTKRSQEENLGGYRWY